MWEHLRTKHRVKVHESNRSMNSMPAAAGTAASSLSSMSSLMFDLFDRMSAVTVNTANVTGSAEAANAGQPVTAASQTPLPTVTVSSSNDVASSSVVLPVPHRSTRQQRESILNYIPLLTCREAPSYSLSDSRSVSSTAVLMILFVFRPILGTPRKVRC